MTLEPPISRVATDRPETAKPILDVLSLRKYFPIRNAWGRRKGWLKAVDDVSFRVAKGEILGVVGESGCGKSTLGKTIMGIHQPSDGDTIFEGRSTANYDPGQARKLRRHLQYAYQDPGASLDPRWKIRRSLHEPMIIHQPELDRDQRAERVSEMMRAVNLPETHLDLYPHEISGGQQRRVGLARVLTLNPSLIILDEPTSGLDLSVQATILTLFMDLKRKFDLTYLFISHDLSIVRMICDRVAVMYLGKVVEIGDTEIIFSNPKHPYTRSLLSAVPTVGGRRVTDDFQLEGEPPNPGNMPSGCRFRTRCTMAQADCAKAEPPLRADWPGQSAACFLAE
ncbi:ABC transporter ATP-binding protein [Salipiger abyssi]|uniref:ABC transporter ATP-binding protein n=1 Tax=Salipiger abyssi TaxID=1250539 RepID=UPI001A8FC132|nr:oligopeptide/dipeptide ABC transporter ATP-binding protein [Salipiger abyssi]MBN9887213.1 ATP-binding cassette domain-containing protein [Salipiger abyssi]